MVTTIREKETRQLFLFKGELKWCYAIPFLSRIFPHGNAKKVRLFVFCVTCFFSLRYYYNFYHHYHYFDVIISMICFYLKNDLLHMTKKTYFLSSIFQFIQLIPCTLQLTLPSEFFPRKIKHFKARIIPYCI